MQPMNPLPNAIAPYRSEMPDVPSFLGQTDQLGVVQRKEIFEFFGFETRNKYSVHMPDGREVAFCAEQGKGFLEAISRQMFGHWRGFELHMFDAARQPIMTADHPFRFFFQRLTVKDGRGRILGAIQRRWGVFTKSFDVHDASGRVIFNVRSPFWKVWTFKFFRGGRQLAAVEKKWSGFLTEMFTDADRFGVSFDPSLPPHERALVLFAAVYIDILYFENKQGGGPGNVIDLLSG